MSNVAICLLVFGANFLLIYKMHDSLDVEIAVSIYYLAASKKKNFFSTTDASDKKFNFKFNLRRAELQYWKSLGSITIPHGRVVILVNVLVISKGVKSSFNGEDRS